MAHLEPVEDRALVDRAVLEGPVGCFRCLAEAGFDLAAPTSGPGTPLDWARHGRGHDRRPPEDYAALEQLLVTAGGVG